jgi:hypothetical protein
MCKYSYLSGACANRRVDSLHCVGEDGCEYSGMNILGSHTKRGHSDTGASRWLGLFCETHGRFLCDVGEDCAAPRVPRARKTSYLQRRLDEDREIW